MSALHDRLESLLKSRADRRILRSLAPQPSTSSSAPTKLIDFSSNDYLSFARSPALRSKIVHALQGSERIYGPPSSRLLDGNTNDHLALEQRLATFFGARTIDDDAATDKVGLLFNSGFDANVSLWTTLPAPDDFVVFDELIHASTHDGMRASRTKAANRRSFAHNSVADLARVLKGLLLLEGVREGLRSVWVTTETLFSMDGDLAPLREMVDLVEEILPRGNGHWVVDEAHSTGLYGSQGRGVVSALGLESRITVRVHTFGKAMACTGAVVLANPLIRSYLINYARPLIYSTVMPYMNVVAIAKSFEMLEEGHGDPAAKHVHALSSLFLSLLSKFLSPTCSISLPPTTATTSSSVSAASPSHRSMPTTSPIIPLLTANPRALSTYLIGEGFLVRPISWPTVPRGEERVRICLHAGNTTSEVRQLARVLQSWCAKTEDPAEMTIIAKL